METKLDLRAEKAIRSYLAKLFVVPSVILIVSAFFLGYFINTTAHKEAKIDAYENFQTAQSNADDNFRAMIAKLYDEIDEARKKIIRAEINIGNSVNNTTKLIKSAEELQNKVASLDAIIKAGNLSSDIAKDPAFRANIVSGLKKSLQQKIVTGSDGDCIISDVYQVCWGKQLLETKVSTHTRHFSFKFPIEFSSIPVVTNGINANSSGWAYSVFTHSINNSTYSGAIVEHSSRKSVTPVSMNYMAISKI